MIYSSWDIECGRLKLVMMDHFLPFYPAPIKIPQKMKFEKMKKNCWRYHHVIQMYLKPQSYEVWFLRYGVRHIIFCHFGPCFTLLTQPPSPNNPENQNFEKLKKASRDHFTHVYQKSQSYDLCFLRYGARQTEFFLIFDHFLTFYPT